MDESLPFLLARGLIRWIGMLGRSFPCLTLRSGERMVQFRDAGFENPLELLALACWQHLFWESYVSKGKRMTLASLAKSHLKLSAICCAPPEPSQQTP